MISPIFIIFIVNTIQFTTSNYCVKESDGFVSVCVEKSRENEFDFILVVTASESLPQSAERNTLF